MHLFLEKKLGKEVGEINSQPVGRCGQQLVANKSAGHHHAMGSLWFSNHVALSIFFTFPLN